MFASTDVRALLASDVRTIGQVGSTIGIGLLFDTLIVRALMTPSIAALLGRLVLVAAARSPEARQCAAAAHRALARWSVRCC